MTLSFRYLTRIILLNSLLMGCGYNAPNPPNHLGMEYAAGNNKKSPKGHGKPERPIKGTEPKNIVIKNNIKQPQPHQGQVFKPNIGQSGKKLVVESTPRLPKAEPPAEIPASIDP